MLDHRMLLVATNLVEKSSYTKSALLKKVKMTQHQLTYTIDKLNNLLAQNSISVILTKNDSLFLNQQAKKFLIDYLSQDSNFSSYELNMDERKRYILFMLYYYVNQYLSVNHFLDSLKISRTTFMSDLKELEKELAEQQISIFYSRQTGYQLTGEELNIRYYVLKLILSDLSNQGFQAFYQCFISNEEVRYKKELQSIIERQFRKFNLPISTNLLTELYYIFLLTLPRLQAITSAFYSKEDMEIVKQLKEYQVAVNILKQCQLQDESAISFGAAVILSSVVGRFEKNEADFPIIFTLIEQSIDKFEQLVGVRIDSRRLIIEQMYGHMRPAFYRIVFQLPVVNVLHEKIKEEYYDIFYITKEVLRSLSGIIGKAIPDEEVSYITLYFVMILREHATKTRLAQAAAVVCQSGIGSSSLLLQELRKLFPEIQFDGPYSVDEFIQSQKRFDMIFTSVSNLKFTTFGKPIYKVSPIMTELERLQLLSEVKGGQNVGLSDVEKVLEIVGKYSTIHNMAGLREGLLSYVAHKTDSGGNLNDVVETSDGDSRLVDVLSPRYIQYEYQREEEWKTSFQISGQPLLRDGIIEQSYLDAVIGQTINHGPYMVVTDGVALLHAKPEEGVNHLGASLTFYPHGVDVLGKKCTIFFMLAAVDKTKHLPIIADFLKICEDRNLLETVQTLHSSQEAYKVISDFLQEK